MSRLAAKTLAASFVTAALGMLNPSCAENEVSIFIAGVLSPDEQCEITASPSEPRLSRGILDRSFGTPYVANLLIGNQLVPRGSSDQLRAETARFRVEGAIVEVQSTDGGTLDEFSTTASGVIDPAEGSEPGYGFASVILIPPDVGANEVVATVRVFGRTLGGEEIESAEFSFPIELCDKCLIQFPGDADNPATPEYDCTPSEDDPISTSCAPGQDSPIDCRACVSFNPGCLAP